MDDSFKQGPAQLTVELKNAVNLKGSLAMPGAVRDYDGLVNKPEINGVTVEGSKSGDDFGLVDESSLSDHALNYLELLNILND